MYGKGLEITTGIFVQAENCDPISQTIKAKTNLARILNIRLDKMVSKINDIYNQLESIREPFNIESIKNRLNEKRKRKLPASNI